MVLSVMSSAKVFHLCEHRTKTCPKRQIAVWVICALLGPLMPAIILANYIFYREQEYSLKRDLQCHGVIEHDLGIDEEQEAKDMAKEELVDKDNNATKVSLFRKIQKLRYRAALNRRYYSYYRVIQAAIESFAGNGITTRGKSLFELWVTTFLPD